MTHSSNIPPTLQALITGWRQPTCGGTTLDAVASVLADALEKSLWRHPVVPLSELREAIDVQEFYSTLRCSLVALIAKYTPKPSNPYPPGTYLWAREEHARGFKVRRLATRPGYIGYVNAEAGWSSCKFTHADFTATDWEVVP